MPQQWKWLNYINNTGESHKFKPDPKVYFYLYSLDIVTTIVFKVRTVLHFGKVEGTAIGRNKGGTSVGA